ncbi:MAG TPA: type III pantothenate kinase [Verrucomicrobiae bacterium]|nr:type III pantothenate kinase [Verrucomicrobiae bacterium]
MLLALDVGNSNLTVGVFQGTALVHDGRFATRRDATCDELGIQLRGLLAATVGTRVIDRAAICSVVPSIDRALREAVVGYFDVQPLLVGPGTRSGIRIHYDPPRDVGADRIVTALAVRHRYGGPAIIVDFGTATTVDAINAEGDYLGGVIVPGVRLSLDALSQRAARLPWVELAAPGPVLARTTVASMQAGVVYGVVGQVEEIVRRMLGEMGTPATVVATGGLAELLAPHIPCIDRIDPLVTLEGLRLIAEMNPAGA